jgi:hypothetical protein
MLVPLLSFGFGLVLAIVTVLIYRGSSRLRGPALLDNLIGDVVFLWGNSLVALAAMLGVAGYWNVFNGNDLRLGRIFLLLLGVLLSGLAVLNRLDEQNPLRRLPLLAWVKTLDSLKVIRYLLTGLAAVALLLIFLIAFFDYNYGGDAFMYHVPFAARLWGIITPEQYTFEYFTENRFLGFPLLANWLQGLFWVIFQRIEATNLVAYSSLIIFLVYLVGVAQIPFYLATLSLLAIPMVYMHAARSYIDLPGNVGIAILILTLYLLYARKLALTPKILLILFLAAFTAANIKLQLIPLVFLLVLAAMPLILRHYWRPELDRASNLQTTAKVLGLGTLASLLIFFTPIKNILLYQNPVYPVKITLAGQVLNHTEESPSFMHPNIRQLPPPLRWGRSILEIDAFDARRPWPWTLAMDFISWNEERFGMGGYFGAYVVFNLVLFAVLCGRDWGWESQLRLLFLGAMTGVTVWMPQSYELRYYMYWMIVLVCLNTYQVCQVAQARPGWRNPFKPEYFGLVALVFILIFVQKTNKFFSYPAFQPLAQQIRDNSWMVEPKIFNQIQDGDKICLVGKAPHSFFYSAYFHPGRNYQLRSEFNLEDERMKDTCQGWKILR